MSNKKGFIRILAKNPRPKNIALCIVYWKWAHMRSDPGAVGVMEQWSIGGGRDGAMVSKLKVRNKPRECNRGMASSLKSLETMPVTAFFN